MVVWLKRIVSYITVFIAIGYLVYTTIKAPVDLYQYNYFYFYPFGNDDKVCR